VRVAEGEDALAAADFVLAELRAVIGETLAPVLEASLGNRERDLDAESGPDAAGRGKSERKEREVGSGMTVGVGVEEVVRARVVLVHALLHEPHAEHAGVEVQVLLGVAGDRRDVMDAGDV
jgi:hypothetical protein